MIPIPESIKTIIYSYIITPSAFYMKKEIARCLAILNQNHFKEFQTIWSVMTIDWYDYYKTHKDKYGYFKNTTSLFRHDLMIAKQIHISNFYDTYILHDSNMRYLKDMYQKEFLNWIEYIKWSETK